MVFCKTPTGVANQKGTRGPPHHPLSSVLVSTQNHRGPRVRPQGEAGVLEGPRAGRPEPPAFSGATRGLPRVLREGGACAGGRSPRARLGFCMSNWFINTASLPFLRTSCGYRGGSLTLLLLPNYYKYRMGTEVASATCVWADSLFEQSLHAFLLLLFFPSVLVFFLFVLLLFPPQHPVYETVPPAGCLRGHPKPAQHRGNRLSFKQVRTFNVPSPNVSFVWLERVSCACPLGAARRPAPSDSRLLCF